MWHKLVHAYQERREPAYTAEDALRDVAILETVDRSIKTRKKSFSRKSRRGFRII
jgi:hypothetical protein